MHNEANNMTPAKNEHQRQFMGAELARKRAGEKTKTGMTEEQLRDFAMKAMDNPDIQKSIKDIITKFQSKKPRIIMSNKPESHKITDESMDENKINRHGMKGEFFIPSNIKKEENTQYEEAPEITRRKEAVELGKKIAKVLEDTKYDWNPQKWDKPKVEKSMTKKLKNTEDLEILKRVIKAYIEKALLENNSGDVQLMPGGITHNKKNADSSQAGKENNQEKIEKADEFKYNPNLKRFSPEWKAQEKELWKRQRQELEDVGPVPSISNDKFVHEVKPGDKINKFKSEEKMDTSNIIKSFIEIIKKAKITQVATQEPEENRFASKRHSAKRSIGPEGNKLDQKVERNEDPSKLSSEQKARLADEKKEGGKTDWSSFLSGRVATRGPESKPSVGEKYVGPHGGTSYHTGEPWRKIRMIRPEMKSMDALYEIIKATAEENRKRVATEKNKPLPGYPTFEEAEKQNEKAQKIAKIIKASAEENRNRVATQKNKPLPGYPTFEEQEAQIKDQPKKIKPFTPRKSTTQY